MGVASTMRRPWSSDAIPVMPHTRPRSRANFDIGVLFYNRARQTADCVLSFLHEELRPNVVVLDQGSAADQRELLDRALGDQPEVRIVTLSENVGVAAGRNRLCRECSAEWILFVDNDVTLNTRGGVALIDAAVADAGNADGFSPRVLTVNENRFLDRQRLARNNGHLQRDPIGPDVTTTNMFAGGAVILRRSMLLDNPYDERTFVGFEDFDLALCAFTAGRPLQLRSLAAVTLAHKHMPVGGEPDVAATRTRYSAPLITKSFELLKARYGGELFDDWEPWAARQQKDMIIDRRIDSRTPDDKMKIAFIVDVPNWALDNVVRNLARNIGDGYELTTVYAQGDEEPGHALQRVVESAPHIIHVMWRTDFRRLVCTPAVKRCAELMGLCETEIVDRLCQSYITFSVTDHLYLDADGIAAYRPLYWLCDGYCVISPMMLDIYRAISDYPAPTALIPNGVDTDLYRPAQQPKRKKSTITIGWVGNSSWGVGQGLTDAKGLQTIIRPAIDVLRAEGIDVELMAIDRRERWRPREEVAALYPEMDIFVCASSIEGTPNTVFEAVACGVPVVSTRVGIVPWLLGPRQQVFIVDRSVEAFTEALRRLCLDADLRASLARENLEQRAKHDWASRAPLWRQFFADVIRQAHPDAGNWRRLMIERFFLAVDPPRAAATEPNLATVESTTPAIDPSVNHQARDRSMIGQAVNALRSVRTSVRTWLSGR
jgi:GT2 family glycosyltransferase